VKNKKNDLNSKTIYIFIMNKCRGQPTCLIINLSLFIYISCKLKHFLYEITIKKAI